MTPFPLQGRWSTDPDQRSKFRDCSSRGPIHTFSLSNQECDVDMTNRLHLEKKWPAFFLPGLLVLPRVRCRATFAIARVFRPGDFRSDVEISPSRKRQSTIQSPHLFLARPVHRRAKGFRSLCSRKLTSLPERKRKRWRLPWAMG